MLINFLVSFLLLLMLLLSQNSVVTIVVQQDTKNVGQFNITDENKFPGGRSLAYPVSFAATFVVVISVVLVQ